MLSNQQQRAASWELVTIRANEVASGDVIELPSFVHMLNDKDAKWIGRDAAVEPCLRLPRWHHVYDVIDDGNAAEYLADAAWQSLNDCYVPLRIGSERPDSRNATVDVFVALHEYELIRAQRAPRQPWVVLEHEGTAVHWDDSSPGLQVFMVDWDEAEDNDEYTAAKLDELRYRAGFLPGKVRARLREQLER